MPSKTPAIHDEPLCDSIHDTARRLGCCERHILNEISAGRLRSFKSGRRRLVSREAQRDYVREREAAD